MEENAGSRNMHAIVYKLLRKCAPVILRADVEKLRTMVNAEYNSE